MLRHMLVGAAGASAPKQVPALLQMTARQEASAIRCLERAGHVMNVHLTRQCQDPASVLTPVHMVRLGPLHRYSQLFPV